MAMQSTQVQKTGTRRGDWRPSVWAKACRVGDQGAPCESRRRRPPPPYVVVVSPFASEKLEANREPQSQNRDSGVPLSESGLGSSGAAKRSPREGREGTSESLALEFIP